jgi:hypothetical protein
MDGIQTRLKLIAANSGARVRQHISHCGNIVIPFAFIGANSDGFNPSLPGFISSFAGFPLAL